jgi:hypothetical protein
VIGLSARRPTLVAESAAISGLLMVAAHSWTPLAVLAAPAALVVLRRGRRGPGRRSVVPWLFGLGLLGLAGAGGLRALLAIVRQVEVTEVVVATGGGQTSSVLPLLILLIVSGYVSLSFASWLRRLSPEPEDDTLTFAVTTMLWTPLVGAAVLVPLLVAQLRAIGTTAYYFAKFVVGLELVLVPVTATLCGLLVAATLPVQRKRLRPVAVSIVLAAGATQLLGHLAWRDVAMVSPPSALPDHSGVPVRLEAGAGDLLAASSAASADSHHVDYLALRSGHSAQLYLPDAWFHALSGGLTTDTFARMRQLDVMVTGMPDAATVARKLLADRPDTRVLVAPEFVAPLRHELSAPDLAARVTTWSSDASVETEGER